MALKQGANPSDAKKPAGEGANPSPKRHKEIYGAMSTTEGKNPHTGPPRHPGRNLHCLMVASRLAREAASKARAAFGEAKAMFITPTSPTLKRFLACSHITIDNKPTRAILDQHRITHWS
ncbi:hypothetical protein PSTG_08360 [Puccinia striiformis f. sp. tritici PST-78]|uniref:Uncharacterized protein n=2 Tax=Puccinia striiformis f. sp. tritici TaxID=168172 RepID=A0A0L0VGY8_9BASI|nr:hypothetical protein PSTG_08360 [Puccinia striiformis f. sp. tritici PST-78]